MDIGMETKEEFQFSKKRTRDGPENGDGACKDFSSKCSIVFGNIFYRLGFFVGSHPWHVVIGSFLITVLMGTGFFRFNLEKNPLKLWVPRESTFLLDTKWIMANFQEGYRDQTIIVTAPNVLEPKYLAKVAIINDAVTNITAHMSNGTAINWNDICFKIPIITKVNEEDEFGQKKNTSWSKSFLNPKKISQKLVCSVVNILPQGCLQNNVVDIWKYDIETIKELTQEKLLMYVNQVKLSPVTGHPINVTQMLGDIRRNETSNEIIGATSLMSQWFLYVNFSDIDHDKVGNMAGTEDFASEQALLWETQFLKVIGKLREELEDDDFKIFYNAGRSYGDISAGAMFQDMNKLLIGGSLMFTLLLIVLSKFSWLEFRAILGCSALASVALAYAVTLGFCSWLDVSYGPVHNSLPFLLMGLGVDDVFVIMACWRKIEVKNHHKSIPERIGIMLQEAGVSVTVTSVTDIVAFSVGASTVLPSLESFCIYAGIGVFFTYIFCMTFFVAILTLDEYRIAARRNGLWPFIVHSEEHVAYYCDENLMTRTLTFLYSNVILTTPGKIFIVLFVMAYTALGIKGVLHLEQKFDPSWFVPISSYLSKYMATKEIYYPDMGYEGGVYLGHFNYSSSMAQMIEMSSQLKNRSDIIFNYNSWVEPFDEYVEEYYNRSLASNTVSEDDWRDYLTRFLFSHEGGRYQANFGFQRKLKCGRKAPNISVSYFSFHFKRFENRAQYLPAMYDLQRIVKETNLTTNHKFVWGKIFGNWITDEIIDTEVLRNIILALICVMVVTGVLITNFQICFWIFVCVLLTLVNVAGFMSLWGLTIDLVSCIALELAVGLCVDYAAHVGHTFLTIRDPSKTKRAIDTITHIGAAVLYGGSSTLLGLSMLSGSEAYIFKAFFRIFLLVVGFGLFHGLVLLPVILSLVGPKPYKGGHFDNDGEEIDEKGIENGDRELLNISDNRNDITFIKTSNTDASDKEEQRALNGAQVKG